MTQNKTKTITKSMKYRIKYNKELYKILKDIQYETWLIKNKSITMAYDWQQFSFGYKSRFGNYPKEKQLLGKTLTSDIYNQLLTMGESMASSTYNSVVKESVDKFNEQKGKMLKGEESLVNYKRNGSFPIRATQIKNFKKINNKAFEVDLSLLSTKRVKKLKEDFKESNKNLDKQKLKKELSKIKTQLSVTLMSGKGATEILDRIINGEYKLADSRITMDRKNKFYLSITYKFSQRKRNLNKKNTMGIDLGINVPAMLAISNNSHYRMRVGDGKEILDFQKQMKERKRRIQQSRKWAGKGSVGHGVKTRIKPLEKLSGKISRFKEQKNHVWSRYIIDEAVKHDCGTIQMEDLTGISENSSFLKTWTYYDLQEKIINKAKEVGIEVVKIDPNCTSLMCNRCGTINKENRDGEKNQAEFKCQNKNCEMYDRVTNADLNAARNIATEGIEDIIKEQIKVQKKASKTA